MKEMLLHAVITVAVSEGLAASDVCQTQRSAVAKISASVPAPPLPITMKTLPLVSRK